MSSIIFPPRALPSHGTQTLASHIQKAAERVAFDCWQQLFENLEQQKQYSDDSRERNATGDSAARVQAHSDALSVDYTDTSQDPHSAIGGPTIERSPVSPNGKMADSVHGQSRQTCSLVDSPSVAEYFNFQIASQFSNANGAMRLLADCTQLRIPERIGSVYTDIGIAPNQAKEAFVEPVFQTVPSGFSKVIGSASDVAEEARNASDDMSSASTGALEARAEQSELPEPESVFVFQNSTGYTIYIRQAAGSTDGKLRAAIAASSLLPDGESIDKVFVNGRLVHARHGERPPTTEAQNPSPFISFSC